MTVAPRAGKKGTDFGLPAGICILACQQPRDGAFSNAAFLRHDSNHNRHVPPLSRSFSNHADELSKALFR
jgi:hypothetical protein